MYEQVRVGRKSSVKHVMAVVTEHCGVSIEDILICTRGRKEIIKPRQIAMALAYELCGISLPKVGRFFGRDHTTVMHAVKQARKLYADELATLRELIVSTYEPEVFDMAFSLPKRKVPKKEAPKKEPEPIVEEPTEARATSFTPRKGKPAPVIAPSQRASDVTGALCGDPGHGSLRVARGETSKGVW